MFTMLNCKPNICMMPKIQIQLTAKGKKANKLNSMLPKESHRNRNTTNPQTKPI